VSKAGLTIDPAAGIADANAVMASLIFLPAIAFYAQVDAAAQGP
jgi:hypothetical protein